MVLSMIIIFSRGGGEERLFYTFVHALKSVIESRS